MMRAALTGRTVIVTTADPGIAAATSHALSGAGASVVLAAPDGMAGADRASGRVVVVPTDITNPVSVRRLVEQTLGAFGRLDAAFNNAHADGVALAMDHEIPVMRCGRIVNLATSPGTQAAVVALTRAAALDVAGVRVNALSGLGSAEDIAEAVVWLCGDEVPFANGDILRVPLSGGRPCPQR